MPVSRWRLSPRRGDAWRHALCLVVRHRWSTNRTGTQRVCDRCWLIEDHL